MHYSITQIKFKMLLVLIYNVVIKACCSETMDVAIRCKKYYFM